MSNVSAYAGALVVGEPSQITLNDADQDGDLWNFPQIQVFYEDPGKMSKIEWAIVDRKPIITRWKDHEGHDHQAINSVVLVVIPKLPLPGCLPSSLARLVPSRRKKVETCRAA